MYHGPMIAVKEQIAGDIFPMPWGWIGVAWTGRGIRTMILPKKDRAAVVKELDRVHGRGWRERRWPEFRRAAAAYFAGKRVALAFPLDLPEAGPFTRRVRDAARRIAPGKTVTYGELARRAGNPRGARAAGRVMARNPVPLLIPCHRVVGRRGFGGFAAGLALKRRLLALEKEDP